MEDIGHLAVLIFICFTLGMVVLNFLLIRSVLSELSNVHLEINSHMALLLKATADAGELRGREAEKGEEADRKRNELK